MHAGKPSFARQLSADIRSVTAKYTAGADKLVGSRILFFFFCNVCAKVDRCTRNLSSLEGSASVTSARDNLDFFSSLFLFWDVHRNGSQTGGADLNSSGK